MDKKEAELSTCYEVKNGDINLKVISEVCVCCVCFDCEEMREENELDREIYDEDGDLVDLENICDACTAGNMRVPCDGFRCQSAIEEVQRINWNLRQKEWINMAFKTPQDAINERKLLIKGLRTALKTGIYHEF